VRCLKGVCVRAVLPAVMRRLGRISVLTELSLSHGVPRCRACGLQLTVILLQILSCSDVVIDIHVEQMEHESHPFDTHPRLTVLTHLISARLYFCVCDEL